MEEQTPLARPLALMSVAASEDAALLTRWESHLRQLEQAHLLSFWSDLHLLAGADRAKAQEQHLQSADVVLLLLSASFFNSSHCLTMMEAALTLAQTGSLRVIPLLLRPVAWQDSPLGEFTPLPSNGKPVLQWRDRDEGWLTCVQELRRILGQSIWKRPPPQSSPMQTDPDWQRMLRRLHRPYKELLSQSLHGTAWVELGLSIRPELVRNVTTLLFRLPQGGERLLPGGTRLVDVYNEAEGELLILGAPGAGKSTLLLDLALQLVHQAQTWQIHLLPVIFRLSSWARGRFPLAEWMVEELNQTYDVPRHLCKRWVEQGRVLALLDGLDEVQEAARPACIAAINTYHLTHLTPLVVCSRQTEYEVMVRRERLALQNAVIVQPLRDEQIEDVLSAAGSSFAGVRSALHQKSALWELATSPLMLNVLLQTYRDAETYEVSMPERDLESQVWTDYVKRMVQEKGLLSRYPLSRTHAWLSWLARQMQAHQHMTFYAEHLHPGWLASGEQSLLTRLTTWLPSLVIGICAGFLVSYFLGWATDEAFLLQMGVLGGFVGGCLSPSEALERPSKGRNLQTSTLRSLFHSVLFAIGLAAISDLSLPPEYAMSDRLREGGILGIGSLLSGWIFQILLDHLPKQSRPASSRHLHLLGRLVAWGKSLAPPRIWWAGTTLALGTGLSSGLSVGLSYGLSEGLSSGLIVGLSANIIVILVHSILDHSLGRLRFAERLRWTWRGLILPHHLRAVLIVATMVFLFFVLIFALKFVLISLMPVRLTSVLVRGLVPGLSQGLSIGLSYWLVLGLYHGMKQEHLSEESRTQFNQGIHRSARNGFLLSLISALIITAMVLLNGELRHWLSCRLMYGFRDGPLCEEWHWLSYEVSYWPTLLLIALGVMWALCGGPTVLRHYVIRWFLARRQIFPGRAFPFLEDATRRILLRRGGGGYSFIHRRLQDYFADAAPREEMVEEKGKSNRNGPCG